MTGRLQDKVTIVTGGGDGFGAGIVDKFVAEGAKVVIMDINEETAQKRAALYPNGRTIALQGDVSSEASWENALEKTISEFGCLDIVVNNAGICPQGGSSTEVSEKEFARLFDVNVKQLFWSTKLIIPHFIKRKKIGVFVNISSISASRPRPNLVWYAASKSAVCNATKGLAIEWAKERIRFNAILPAAGDTNMVAHFLDLENAPDARKQILSTIPMARLCTPADIGNAACFLASEEASFITGVCLGVDGGRDI